MTQEEVAVQKNGVEKKNGEAGVAVVYTAAKVVIQVEAPKASEAAQFYKDAFGAEEVARTMHSKRKADQELPLVLSADLKLGSFVFSVTDFSDDPSLLKTGGVFMLETENVEAAIKKAVTAGAVDVEGKLKDPYGNVWVISSPANIPAPAADVEA